MRKKAEKWVVLAKSADFNGIGKTYGVDPVIARVVRNREVVGEQEMDEYFHPSVLLQYLELKHHFHVFVSLQKEQIRAYKVHHKAINMHPSIFLSNNWHLIRHFH